MSWIQIMRSPPKLSSSSSFLLQYQSHPSSPGYLSCANPSSSGCGVSQHSTFKLHPLHVGYRASDSVLVKRFSIAAQAGISQSTAYLRL
ncbi:hypothetical protein GALMADRAFT_230612 [Galerina marginata CBS 339.88]|uniref:Uncharacterized protein n=1 Tax=Galerina marginata (strain CBS 339.88) TaxID=685588 RepID=A0A067SFJ5_GALM3|nr:hypothetical protein GALMADRAFT_230612 [Galerina marginata CBS 339.88]